MCDFNSIYTSFIHCGHWIQLPALTVCWWPQWASPWMFINLQFHTLPQKKENNTILTVSLKLRWKEAAIRVISVFSMHRKQPDERQTACMLTAHPFNCQSEQSWSYLFLKLLSLLQRSITRSNLRAYHLQGTYTHWRSGRFGVGSVLWLQWPYFTSHDLLTSQPDKHLPVGFWPAILHSYS